MAYKQPRVPPMREEAKLAGYLRELILFLKDFCMETWLESRQQEAKMQAMQAEISALRARLDAQT